MLISVAALNQHIHNTHHYAEAKHGMMNNTQEFK